MLNASVVFVTLLTNSITTEYSLNTERWVKQLLCVGVAHNDIMILVTPNVNVKRLQKYNVHIHTVPAISVGTKIARYKLTPTKIYLWTLIQYKKVIYYDTDMFFFRNPYECYSLCPIQAKLCVVSDPAANFPKSDPNYFNSGFMILSPSLETFNFLKSNIHIANGKTFSDQDMLNIVFKNTHTFVDSKCNLLHAPDDFPNIAKSKSVVAVHEKFIFFARLIPDNHPIRLCINTN